MRPLAFVWWQWTSVLGLAVGAWVSGLGCSWAARKALRRVATRTENPWDDALIERLRGPLALAAALVVFRAGLPLLLLSPGVLAALERPLGALGLVALFWALWRATAIGGEILKVRPWSRDNPSVKSLLAIGVAIGDVGVLVAGAIAVLSHLGYPVASLLAGLGIGGLALALAAQKTGENLFGSLALAIDQPLRVGDFVKVDDVVGTVEAIGLRSTRFRTLDRTLVTLPNGRLADMRIETFAARDRLRLAFTLGVEYGTALGRLRGLRDALEARIRAHPKVWPEVVVVRLAALGPSSIDFEVMAWFLTSDWGEFQGIREEVLLGCLEVVERAGANVAFPTRTVHVVSDVAGAGGSARCGPGDEKGVERR